MLLAKMEFFLSTSPMLNPRSVFTISQYCFNVCLLHGKISQQYMKTLIVSIYKNKNVDKSDADNCRLCSLATYLHTI